MGSLIEINDTLQITKEQGFPEVLDLEKHLNSPLKAEQFSDMVFEFRDKPKIRQYQQYPIRNFLAENRDGKWIYWGLIQITEVTHDFIKQTTSGKFKITYIYTPEEMQQVHDLAFRHQN